MPTIRSHRTAFPSPVIDLTKKSSAVIQRMKDNFSIGGRQCNVTRPPRTAGYRKSNSTNFVAPLVERDIFIVTNSENRDHPAVSIAIDPTFTRMSSQWNQAGYRGTHWKNNLGACRSLRSALRTPYLGDCVCNKKYINSMAIRMAYWRVPDPVKITQKSEFSPNEPCRALNIY